MLETGVKIEIKDCLPHRCFDLATAAGSVDGVEAGFGGGADAAFDRWRWIVDT